VQFLVVLASTGMRISECCGILLDRIDFEHQAVEVFGKGGRWRVVPFDGRAAKALAQYIRRERRGHLHEKSENLWLTERGPMCVRTMSTIVKDAGKQAGVADCHAHRYRHSFADSWLAEGGSEGGLMAIAGWRTREMVDRYSSARATDRAIQEYKRLRH
jgi:site-specific recombinase XerD